jgi:hypothetical protein
MYFSVQETINISKKPVKIIIYTYGYDVIMQRFSKNGNKYTLKENIINSLSPNSKRKVDEATEIVKEYIAKHIEEDKNADSSEIYNLPPLLTEEEAKQEIKKRELELSESLDASERFVKLQKIHNLPFGFNSEDKISEDEKKKREKILYLGGKNTFYPKGPEHKYICPKANNPKACVYNIKKKTCEMPKSTEKCRHIYNKIRNRTKDIAKIDNARENKETCDFFYNASEVAGGMTLNFKKLRKKTKQTFFKLKGSKTFDPTEKEDLLILLESIDKVYFQNTLQKWIVKKKIPFNFKYYEREDDTYAFYSRNEQAIFINLRKIKPKKEYKDVISDGMHVSGMLEYFIALICHELSHMLVHKLKCPEDNADECHGPIFRMFNKYFFGHKEGAQDDFNYKAIKI